MRFPIMMAHTTPFLFCFCYSFCLYCLFVFQAMRSLSAYLLLPDRAAHLRNVFLQAGGLLAVIDAMNNGQNVESQQQAKQVCFFFFFSAVFFSEPRSKSYTK